MNPTPMAAQRRQPTASFRIGTESAATTSGAAAKSAMVGASPTTAKAVIATTI